MLREILESGDMIGRDEAGRVVITLALEPCLFEKLAAGDEEREPETCEHDDAP